MKFVYVSPWSVAVPPEEAVIIPPLGQESPWGFAARLATVYEHVEDLEQRRLEPAGLETGRVVKVEWR